MKLLRERFEALDAEDRPDYARVLAESETDDRLGAAMGEAARNPEAVEKLLGRSRLSPRSQHVARDPISSFTGAGD